MGHLPYFEKNMSPKDWYDMFFSAPKALWFLLTFPMKIATERFIREPHAPCLGAAVGTDLHLHGIWRQNLVVVPRKNEGKRDRLKV